VRETAFSETKMWAARPQRVVLLSCVAADGRPNLIAIGWTTVACHDPPMVAVSVGHDRYSHGLIASSGQFVMAVPGEDIADAVLTAGTCSGARTDKFSKTGLTPLPASVVRPPLVAEALVNLECVVRGSLVAGDHTLFVGEVVRSWRSDKEGGALVQVGAEKGYRTVASRHGYKIGVIA
jgi:flavin reductase (DIM6/NTAB) family NADH-FMN oxidoreductase RutF